MTYSVTEQTIDGQETIGKELTLDDAIAMAEAECGEEDRNIFIEWHRVSDGQRGYYNRNGNAITGQAW